ncbi:MAG: SUMF1/EgtB/PvdO family nonheme iron enzyme, partial [Myxococcota bacterium]|nr:SUMF1/EgtB/PvdO family nonheme iron enzyme [Myxococcota bacterium]
MRSTLVLLAAFVLSGAACYGGIHLSGDGGAGGDSDVFDDGDDPGDADTDGSCTPQCVFWEGFGNEATKRCGDDRCGGSCGACPAGLLCLDGFWCRDVIGCGDRCEEQVFIPAGPFFRGCDPSRFVRREQYCRESMPGFNPVIPQHEVFLSAYYIDRFEVVHRRYQRCVDAGVCEAPGLPYGWGESWFPAEGYFDERPAVGVSREMAERFCLWEGKRLPTEAEWEKAARGGCELRGDPAACDWIEDAPRYVWGNDDESLWPFLGDDACVYAWQECLVNIDNHVTMSIGPAGSYPLD